MIPKASSDFEFIEQMSQLLMKAQKKEIEVPHSQVVEKLCLVKLASYENGKLKALEPSFSWLESSLENRSLYLYRHPQNKILSLSVGERYLREAEKSIKRVLHGKWIVFEEFLKGVLVPLNEQSVISLKRFGKHWKYTLPIYGDEEKAILKAAIFEWLFELGMVYVGTYQGKDCFAVTAFGKFFFSE